MQLPNEMPMPLPLAPVHLAGHFAPHRWEIRLYNEVASGHLELFAADLLNWPDAVVLCGLTATFDRFRHLSAYFRTRNPCPWSEGRARPGRTGPLSQDRRRPE